MRRTATATVCHRPVSAIAGLALTLIILAGGAGPETKAPARAADRADAVAAGDGLPGSTVEWLNQRANLVGRRLSGWYHATPPMDRITWGGLIACGFLGLLTAVERTWRVRKRRVIPRAYRDRFHARLIEGELDWGKGLDYCELNPSPAARVALAAIKRWGRPAPDLDRAVALARQTESDRLRRHVGTLRRVAALAPLLGLLGTLTAAGRSLAALPAGAAWGPVVAVSLMPLTAGVGLAILALVAYDGLMGRVEAIAGELDRIGAEIVDAIALAAVPPAPVATTTTRVERSATHNPTSHLRAEPAAPPRTPHSVRVEVPNRFARQRTGLEDDEF